MVLADLEKTARETLCMSSLDRDGYGANRYTVHFFRLKSIRAVETVLVRDQEKLARAFDSHLYLLKTNTEIHCSTVRSG